MMIFQIFYEYIEWRAFIQTAAKKIVATRGMVIGKKFQGELSVNSNGSTCEEMVNATVKIILSLIQSYRRSHRLSPRTNNSQAIIS